MSKKTNGILVYKDEKIDYNKAVKTEKIWNKMGCLQWQAESKRDRFNPQPDLDNANVGI